MDALHVLVENHRRKVVNETRGRRDQFGTDQLPGCWSRAELGRRKVPRGERRRPESMHELRHLVDRLRAGGPQPAG